MIEKVKRYILDHNLLDKGSGVVAGVSGGADSICLLHILCRFRAEWGIHIYAVHVHHGIRGSEADGDMEFVAALCNELNVTLKVFKYDVYKLAKCHKTSVEEEGRSIRYAAFEEMRRTLGVGKIAVAHNKNDHAETILHNLFRGTGMKGLCGIAPVRGHIIRPLLCVERKEIEHYLSANQIKYRNDSTNNTPEYTRNKIRLDLLPYITENINKQALPHIINVSRQIEENERYLEQLTNLRFNAVTERREGTPHISKDKLYDEDVAIRKRIIRKALESSAESLKDITMQHIESILLLFEKNVGKQVNLPNHILAKRTYDGVLFTDAPPKQELFHECIPVRKMGIYELPSNKGRFSFSIVKNYEKSDKIQEKQYTKCFDYDKINDDLLIRSRRTGDYFVINDQHGKKKLKDYFIDMKIPKDQRDGILLIATGKHIIWVVGFRISNAYKITEHTKTILEVQYIE